MRVVVIDSGVGNIPNALRGLARAGAEVILTEDAGIVASAERVVLPGVGAFPAAMERLRQHCLDAALREAVDRGAALLGICLGHQLLFDGSDEFGDTAGLALLPGRVVALPAVARVPNMGWSRLAPCRSDPLLAGLDGDAWMYFVHSYVAEAVEDDMVATVPFGSELVCAAVRRARVCGVQFHPEKSGAAGARLLSNFMELGS